MILAAWSLSLHSIACSRGSAMRRHRRDVFKKAAFGAESSLADADISERTAMSAHPIERGVLSELGAPSRDLKTRKEPMSGKRRYRRADGRVQPSRMRQLLQTCRLCL